MTVTPSAFWRAQLAARKAAAVSRRAVSSDLPDKKLSSASFSSRRVPMRGVPSVLTGSENMDTAPQCWGLNPILDGMHYTQGDEGLALRSPLKKVESSQFVSLVFCNKGNIG